MPHFDSHSVARGKKGSDASDTPGQEALATSLENKFSKTHRRVDGVYWGGVTLLGL